MFVMKVTSTINMEKTTRNVYYSTLSTITRYKCEIRFIYICFNWWATVTENQMKDHLLTQRSLRTPGRHTSSKLCCSKIGSQNRFKPFQLLACEYQPSYRRRHCPIIDRLSFFHAKDKKLLMLHSIPPDHH